MTHEDVVNKIFERLENREVGITSRIGKEWLTTVINETLTTYRAQVLEEFMIQNHTEWLKEDIKEIAEHREKMKALYPDLFPTN